VGAVLIIDPEVVRTNTMRLVEALHPRGIGICAVVKVVDSEPAIAATALEAGAVALADSRVGGLARLAARGLGPRQLIRTPEPEEFAAAVAAADRMLLSDVDMARQIARRAGAGRVAALLAVDMGDRREGVLPEAAHGAARALSGLPGIDLQGISVNYGCITGCVPDRAALTAADDLLGSLEPFLGTRALLSIGGSYCLPELLRGFAPRHECEVRLGTALLFGHCDGPSMPPGTELDESAPILRATVLECARKPPSPFARPAVDRFGQLVAQPLPSTDAWHVLLAVGRRETEPRLLRPLLPGSYVAGMSSDHTVLIAEEPLPLGSSVEFALDYEGVMRAITSPFVRMQLAYGPQEQVAGRPQDAVGPPRGATAPEGSFGNMG
jgi:predicted amino acid racemase